MTETTLLPRLHDWQSRLAAVVAERQPQAWSRGPLDCCGFAGACVQAITGVDPLEQWGAWSTTREAMRILREHGGLRAAVGEQLGDEILPALAQPGDVGLFNHDGEDGIAVWIGSWIVPTRDGLGAMPDEAISTAWRCTGVPRG